MQRVALQKKQEKSARNSNQVQLAHVEQALNRGGRRHGCRCGDEKVEVVVRLTEPVVEGSTNNKCG